jgi:sugar/nucleoside kinase (ribokinase family)
LVHRGACTELTEDDINWDMLAEARWIYQGSMSGNGAPLFERVSLFAKEHGVKLAINPGSTQLRAGIEKMQPALDASDVIFVNKAEAYRLAGVEPRQGHADEMLVLEALHGAGCEVVVMTDGSRGAEAYDGTTHYTVPAISVEVASTLGAGDAFASACTAALVGGMGLREALRAGALNASNVCRYLGGKRGLLRADEMQKALADRRRST